MTNLTFTFMATIALLVQTNWLKTSLATNSAGARFEIVESQRTTNHIIFAPYHGTQWRFNLETNFGPKVFITNALPATTTNKPSK